MIEPFHNIVSLKDDVDLDEKLKVLHLYEIFKEVCEQYGENRKLLTGLIKFILYGYTVGSEFVHARGKSFSKVVLEIFEYVGLSPELYNVWEYFSSPSVRICVEKWIKHQDDENWSDYVAARDLRLKMLKSINDGIYKEVTLDKGGVVIPSLSKLDYEQMAKNVVHARVLKDMMKESLSSMAEHDKDLKEALRYIHKSKEEHSDSISTEDLIKNSKKRNRSLL